MARLTRASLAMSTDILTREPGLNMEDLSSCRRDRDFTNLLDIKYQYHSAFLKRIREHVETFHTWRELRESPTTTKICVDQFLDHYGEEYWGIQNREKYIMSDSIARGDDVRYPEDAHEISQALVLLFKKKADSLVKDEPQSSQATVTALARIPAQTAHLIETAPVTEAPEELEEFTPTEHHEEDDDEEEDDEEDEDNFAPRPIKKRRTAIFPIRTLPTSDESSLTSETTSLSPYSTHTDTHATPAISSMTSLSLVNTHLEKALRSKWRRDTFFLVTTDTSKAAPAWTKFVNYKSASSFLLEMGRARGLEKKWWTPNAQMEVEGEAAVNFDDHVAAAQQVISMASVKLEWSGKEILVRWENDSDWGIVMQLIHKAWLAKDFGHQLIETFEIRVVLHLEQ
ncbi:uncharacterized protein DSM5745_08351 [Aspergillus mulundensis]|uniref:Uncharacterized protein n=1 Tax=Aspergillus mulundensis TaxID=1810919 RepID=A0A3D8RA57_9EURO|nr:hypothetical protein DSM5745_08351 [Aspergillus mulundensis]RDW70840.1 hypothetical protein DSM5745_08351 [Aspergillus mulundensis]